MQVIQVKYLSATNTMGVRLKAFSNAGSLTEPRKCGLDFSEQAKYLAERYLIEKTWDGHCSITGQGTLPNGDDVFTIGAK